MGKNKSKKKQVTAYQKWVSGIRKVENYLLKQKMEAKKEKRRKISENIFV